MKKIFTLFAAVMMAVTVSAQHEIGGIVGGLNFGLMSALANTNPDYILGKFGINGAVGATYDTQSIPLVLALDFRPGYGMSFANANAGTLHFFDWKIAFAVRYRL